MEGKFEIQDNKIIEEAKKYLTQHSIELLEEELKDSWCNTFEIVNEPKGDIQHIDYVDFYVNQTTNGGYTGDEYSGQCYLKMTNGKYLKWSYEC